MRRALTDGIMYAYLTIRYEQAETTERRLCVVGEKERRRTWHLRRPSDGSGERRHLAQQGVKAGRRGARRLRARALRLAARCRCPDRSRRWRHHHPRGPKASVPEEGRGLLQPPRGQDLLR